MRNQVVSKKGGAYVKAVFGLIAALVVFIFIFIDGLTSADGKSIPQIAFSISMLFAFLFMPRMLVADITINQKGVFIEPPWSEKFIRWDEVAKLQMLTNYFGRYNMIIYKKPSKDQKQNAVLIPTGFYSNMKLLSQAIVDAAFLANNEIEITRFTTDNLGKPPYGLFDRSTLSADRAHTKR